MLLCSSFQQNEFHLDSGEKLYKVTYKSVLTVVKL